MITLFPHCLIVFGASFVAATTYGCLYTNDYGVCVSRKPLANATFEAYAMMNADGSLGAIANFKLGLYMKIPPKAMFLSQVIGNFIASACEFATVSLLFSSVENICRPELLPKGSQWTAYSNLTVYIPTFSSSFSSAPPSNSRLFLARTFPEKKWIRLINVSTIFIAGASMLPVSAINYLSWFAVAFFLKFVVYRKYKRWWAEYGYLLSVAIDTGISLMAFLVTVALQIHNVNGIDWWGLDVSDHCPLATCPTARGVHAEGCPVF
uniref:Uncharacterized protein n=1 Tax=Ananas comosus var. bracteatus TaxID=296719 RepID=A0A6V7P971_ANACO|nr:unnamed protein product [Ananas comosus var. bracteatus]